VEGPDEAIKSANMNAIVPVLARMITFVFRDSLRVLACAKRRVVFVYIRGAFETLVSYHWLELELTSSSLPVLQIMNLRGYFGVFEIPRSVNCVLLLWYVDSLHLRQRSHSLKPCRSGRLRDTTTLFSYRTLQRLVGYAILELVSFNHVFW
jgi:hypothetical protein